jgi:cysteinyl-tRNA synthetase
MIKIYNTLTKKTENLGKNSNINIYICGVTVYDYSHIGHARSFIIYDTLIRYIRYLKYNIFFVRNITDIDDKIINKSFLTGKTVKSLTQKFIKFFREDTKKLNLIEPSFEPKATIFIKDMIFLISNLIKKEIAYISKTGDINFSINKFYNYGVLSNRIISKQKNIKKEIIDFALWKRNFNVKEIYWNSPWGNGRPGWHTECAAMILYYFKKNVHIHGGGQDLIFPHHENERAQCESITDKKFVNIWMHIGQLNIEEKKMAKSSNNHILIKDFLKKNNEEYLRFFFLLSNYNKSINYKNINFESSKKSLVKLYKFCNNNKSNETNILSNVLKEFNHALSTNFNTPKAIAVIFKLLKKKDISLKLKAFNIKYLCNILGLLKHDSNLFISENNKKFFNIPRVNKLIKIRYIARKNYNFNLSDRIRKILMKFGFYVEDKKIN